MKKFHKHNGLAGCVQQRIARRTGTLVGVYHGEQSGVDTDPADPWLTVCEPHGTLCAHQTLAIARFHAVAPDGWCEECAASLLPYEQRKQHVKATLSAYLRSITP